MNKLTQKQRILNELNTKGYLNSFYATYVMGIKQAPTRIYELIHDGWPIKSFPTSRKGDTSVDWKLEYILPKDEYVFIANKAVLKSSLKPEQQKLWNGGAETHHSQEFGNTAQTR